MSDADKSGASALVVGVEGRHLYLYVDDEEDAERRFAFALNGEPIKAAKIACVKTEFARGMNLIENGDCRETQLPWRLAEGKNGRIGRNLSEKWNLAHGFTGYFMAEPGELPAQIEYADAAGRSFVPVAGGETHRFTGYFGTHRCQASIRIDLLDEADAIVTSLEWPIPKGLGGPALDGYGKVDISFAAPSKCVAGKICLSIDRYEATNGSAAAAVLFFTHVSFGLAAANGKAWRARCLDGDQVAALAGKATVLDVTLPRLPSPSIAPLQLDAIDLKTGERTQGSPVLLPSARELKFAATSFDGVTLAGEISGGTGQQKLELAVDGEIASCLTVSRGKDAAPVKLRIDESFLDGAPHVLELREAASGKTLFLNAAIVKAFVTPWEMLQEISRSPLPLELNPMARRRYQSLAAHMAALARDADCADTAHQVAKSFTHLSESGRGGCEMRLAVPAARKPEITVVLCARDVASAYRSLAGIILAYNRISFEVVVALEGSADDAARLRKLVSGVRIVHAARDKGFAYLANRGAIAARGRFVALLNGGAEPSAHWLDELRSMFDVFDGVGLAGAKLIDQNGRLHEAGGIVWASGNRQPVGANANAEHPQVNYARQADYVSATALLIERETWKAIGGLSEDFFNVGLEEADLAFKVGSHGLKVIYAPQAVVTVDRISGAVSERYASSPSAGTATFKRKWADRLAEGQPEAASVHLAIDPGARGRVLFIDQQLPRSDIDGGSYAAIQEMRLFQALGYKVTFLPVNLAHLGVYTRALQRIGIEVIHAPFAASMEEVMQSRGPEFDLVYITRHHVARAVMSLVRKHAPRAKIIFNNADLHFLRELRAALAAKDGDLLRRSRLTRDRELEVMRQADLTLSYSEAEHAVIQSHNFDQSKVAKAPWVAIPADQVAPFSARSDIAFIGSFSHAPNVEAVRFFASQVMPHLRRRLPGIRFFIYGSQTGPQIEALAADDVIVVGHVDDLAAMFAKTRVFIAPLLSGAGLKAKVLCAMAFGVPSVLSPAAAEGVGGQAGTDYPVVQSPDEWAGAIHALYCDETKWLKASKAGLELVRANYSFEKGLETLRRALESIDVFAPANPGALWCRTAFPPLL